MVENVINEYVLKENTDFIHNTYHSLIRFSILFTSCRSMFLFHAGFTMFTHVALPAYQAAPITAARYPVTSSGGSTSRAA